MEQLFHCLRLKRSDHDKEGESCKCARPKVDYEEDEADRHLDRRGPEHMKELATKVDP
jgi:hypothetical protein